MTDPISVVLVSYKRSDELRQIMDHLHANLPVGQVIVHHNDDFYNIGVLARWIAAMDAKYPVCFTQDDDCLVHNCAEILENYRLSGRLSNALKAGHWGIRYPVGPGHETLVGWGAAFNRDWIRPILQEYEAAYPQFRSEHLSVTCMDRIVTTLMRREHNTILADLTDFPSATDPEIAMYLQPGYGEEILECRRRMEDFPKEAPVV